MTDGVSNFGALLATGSAHATAVHGAGGTVATVIGCVVLLTLLVLFRISRYRAKNRTLRSGARTKKKKWWQYGPGFTPGQANSIAGHDSGQQ